MFLSEAPTATRLINIPDGAQGTRATLTIMAGLVRQYRIDMVIRQFAAGLVQHLEAQNYTEEVRAVFFFVRDKVRYLQDVNDVETVQTPVYTLQNRFGDCDDKVTLLASLLESIGHPCRFVAVAYHQAGEYEHVFLKTLIGAKWVPLDPIVADADINWAPMPPFTQDRIYGRPLEWNI